MKIKRLIAAAMAVTAMFSAMSVNAAAAQPQAHISSTGAVYYDENTVTDVEIISSRIINQDDKNCNTIHLNVGVSVYLGNIFKLAEGYSFDDFTYTITDSQGDKSGSAKIIKKSNKYYLKAVSEDILDYIRVFYKGKLIATQEFSVSNDYESASEITVTKKNVKIGEEIVLKAFTENGKDRIYSYADCCWIIVGDSSWELPAAWYTNWNTNEVGGTFLHFEIGDDSWYSGPDRHSFWGKATLSFNDFGKVKIYCLSPNGKLKKVEINISEERDMSNKKFYAEREKFEIGYIKPDGTVVFTNKEWDEYKYRSEQTWRYSWEKKEFYRIMNEGTEYEKFYWESDWNRNGGGFDYFFK